jgi:tetratricopeptide (TPR) repeat protein
MSYSQTPNSHSPLDTDNPILDSIDLTHAPVVTPNVAALLTKQPKNNQPTSRTRSGLLWLRVLFYVFAVGFIVVKILSDDKDRNTAFDLTIRNPIFYGILAIFGLTIFWAVYTIAPSQWVLAALRKGDYQRAANRAKFAKSLPKMKASSAFLEGTVYTFSGDWFQADLALRESIELTGETITSHGAWENLGYVMLGQERYSQAIDCFEHAIELRPNLAGPYSGLAEAYLYQGLNAHRALDLVERALVLKTNSVNELVDAFRKYEMLSVKAWALAAMGNHQEATQVMDETLTRADQKMLPTLASIYLRAGKVYLLGGDGSKARDHFRHASDIDPNGAYGKRAAQSRINI